MALGFGCNLVPGWRLDGSHFGFGSCEIHGSLRKVLYTARARPYGEAAGRRRSNGVCCLLDAGPNNLEETHCETHCETHTGPLVRGRNTTLSRPRPLFDRCLIEIPSHTGQVYGVVVCGGSLRLNEGDTKGAQNKWQFCVDVKGSRRQAGPNKW